MRSASANIISFFFNKMNNEILFPQKPTRRKIIIFMGKLFF